MKKILFTLLLLNIICPRSINLKAQVKSINIVINLEESSGIDQAKINKHFLQKSKAGKIEDIKQLILDGAELNSTNHHGWNALMCAASQQKIDAINYFLANYADQMFKHQDRSGLSVLHLCARKGFTNIAKILIDFNKDIINILDDQGRTALHLAIRENWHETAEFLINNGFNVNQKDNQGWTPLHWAIDSVAGCDLLLENKADINAQDNQGLTPLHWATDKDRASVIKFLIKKGANWQLKDLGNRYFSNYAKEKTWPILEELGFENPYNNVDIKNAEIMSPKKKILKRHLTQSFGEESKDFGKIEINDQFMSACKNSDFNRVEFYINKIDNINSDLFIDKTNGYTPLHYACEHGDLKLVNLLINNKININVKAREGITALHLAAIDNHLKIVQVLCENKIDINATNRVGQTALHISCKNKFSEIIDILLDNKADADVKDMFGKIPLDYYNAEDSSDSNEDADPAIAHVVDEKQESKPSIIIKIDKKRKTALIDLLDEDEPAIKKQKTDED